MHISIPFLDPLVAFATEECREHTKTTKKSSTMADGALRHEEHQYLDLIDACIQRGQDRVRLPR